MSEYLEQVLPTLLVPWEEYLYVIIRQRHEQSTRRPWRLRSEAVEVLKTFKAVAENQSGKRIRKVMTDNVQELYTGEMRELGEREGTKLYMTVPYHSASNGSAEHAIGAFTSAVQACCTTRVFLTLCGRGHSARQLMFITEHRRQY